MFRVKATLGNMDKNFDYSTFMIEIDIVKKPIAEEPVVVEDPVIAPFTPANDAIPSLVEPI